MTDRTITAPTDNPVGRVADGWWPPVGYLVVPQRTPFIPAKRTTFDDLHHPEAYRRPVFWYRSAAQLLALTAALLAFLHQYALAATVAVPAGLALFLYGCLVGTRDAVSGEIRDSIIEDVLIDREEEAHWAGLELAPCDVWPNVLASVPYAGFIYVIRFDTGSIKVGMTNDPKRRLLEHRRHAAAYGVVITAHWVSPSHLNYIDNEAELLGVCREYETPTKKEYFHGLDFDSVVKVATCLRYDLDRGETP